MIITEVIMLVLRLQNNKIKKKSLVIMLTGTHTWVCFREHKFSIFNTKQSDASGAAKQFVRARGKRLVQSVSAFLGVPVCASF